MLLSLGQANVERGLSVNEYFLTSQLKKKTLVANWTVYETVKTLNLVSNQSQQRNAMLC